jgi:hypothetical protein
MHLVEKDGRGCSMFKFLPKEEFLLMFSGIGVRKERDSRAWLSLPLACRGRGYSNEEQQVL